MLIERGEAVSYKGLVLAQRVAWRHPWTSCRSAVPCRGCQSSRGAPRAEAGRDDDQSLRCSEDPVTESKYFVIPRNSSRPCLSRSIVLDDFSTQWSENITLTLAQHPSQSLLVSHLRVWDTQTAAYPWKCPRCMQLTSHLPIPWWPPRSYDTHTTTHFDVYTGHLNAQTNTVFIETNLASYFGSHIRRSEPRSQAPSWMWACPARHREWMDGGLLFWEPTQAPQASSIPPRIVMIGGRPNEDRPL